MTRISIAVHIEPRLFSKQGFDVISNRLHPQSKLERVDRKFMTNLIDGHVTTQCFQVNLGFEVCCVYYSLFCLAQLCELLNLGRNYSGQPNSVKSL